MPIPRFALFLAAAVPPALTPAAHAQLAARHWGQVFISPMGEPFHAQRGGDAMSDWFNQADSNHDGQLTLAEMQKDADRFFAVLDTNHDGEIDPDEIDHYEQVVLPGLDRPEGPAVADSSEPAGRGGKWPGRGRHRRGGGWGDDEGGGAAQLGLLGLPEPVIAADTDFNRGVSLTEFRAAAARRFSALDLDHKGVLTLALLESVRPAPLPGEQKRAAAADNPDVESLPPPDH